MKTQTNKLELSDQNESVTQWYVFCHEISTILFAIVIAE